MNDKIRPRKLPKLIFIAGEDVPTYRRKHRLTQSDFWNKIDVSQSSGSRYEHGRRIPMQVRLLLQIVYGTPKQATAVVDWLRENGK